MNQVNSKKKKRTSTTDECRRRLRVNKSSYGGAVGWWVKWWRIWEIGVSRQIFQTKTCRLIGAPPIIPIFCFLHGKISVWFQFLHILWNFFHFHLIIPQLISIFHDNDVAKVFGDRPYVDICIETYNHRDYQTNTTDERFTFYSQLFFPLFGLSTSENRTWS